MIIYAKVDDRIYHAQAEPCDLPKYQFYGNLEHLLSHLERYHVVGDEIKLDPNFEANVLEKNINRNLKYIRDERKPLLRAFDTLEFKRRFILEGFISQGEFPFIDEMTEDRWQEIKAWRDQLRDLTEGVNVVFPETPQEVTKFL